MQSHLGSLGQELPISSPYTGTQVDELLHTVSQLGLQDYYVNVKQQVPQMDALLHNLRLVSPYTRLLTTRAGELHLQVRTPSGGSFCVIKKK